MQKTVTGTVTVVTKKELLCALSVLNSNKPSLLSSASSVCFLGAALLYNYVITLVCLLDVGLKVPVFSLRLVPQLSDAVAPPLSPA